ncbi:MAG: 3-oxoacyl-[acyl-carrier-protein] synthase III C-terminal domain-containing protein [Mycobacterium sp.]|nr:3-oxoacyl-[acyl-carrier-protein] synthase III C-terminal domain-containing protein [Mycobacterium sp.]
MTDTSDSTFTNTIIEPRAAAPRVAGTAVALTPNRYSQEEVVRELTSAIEPGFARFARTSGVEHRSLALTIDRYPRLTGFTEANTAYLDVATELGERAVRSALEAAKVDPSDVDAIVTVSSTGVAVPTIDARIFSRLGLRPDVKRLPLFGLGCVAGAAGLARVHDYLRGFPDHVAVLLSAELCSLTLQRDDTSIPALIGVSLFGDGAAAVVATGADRVPPGPTMTAGPQVLATRSRLFPDTVDVMGWNISASGFQLVMSRDVPRMAQDHLGAEVADFLAGHGLTTGDVSAWICHPGGPKVLDAVGQALELPSAEFRHSWESMRDNGNISSASVLDVLNRTLAEPPAAGSLGLMVAMGPGFSFELLLLGW